LEPEENIAVVQEVLARHPAWQQVSLEPVIGALADADRLVPGAAESLMSALSPDGALTLLPHVLGPGTSTDGFYAALLRKHT
jgi:16S rRNA C967 or C1407 C5-methylase (RsmB/RsmF family)